MYDFLSFESKNEPGQWICWDFHKRRVALHYYKIRSSLLKSWLVETSLDGKRWTEIDRRTDDYSFSIGGNAATFAIAPREAFRFIRLAQTGKTRLNEDRLLLTAVEFFGTLFE
jgi:hypothetical protein